MLSSSPLLRLQDELPNRLDILGEYSPEARQRLEQFLKLAELGVSQFRGDLMRYAHTGRLVPGETALKLEGDNLRYAVNVAQGVACLDEVAQRRILGVSAADLARALARRAETSQDPGAVALAAWAMAEVAGEYPARLFERLEETIASPAPLATVACAWTLLAALAARDLADMSALCRDTATRLKDGLGKGGVFPHVLPASSIGPLRRHVGSFADQIYAIRAFARYYVAYGDRTALNVANACAARVVAGQGPAGQWSWHYDTRDGSVVERYPVYSVHQHGMAPMGLMDLYQAGGTNYLKEVVRGLRWLDAPPETTEKMVDPERHVIWRKVGRREPAKFVRGVSSLTTKVHPGLRMPGLGALFPAGKVDYECRPYELAWLLYGWLSSSPGKPAIEDVGRPAPELLAPKHADSNGKAALLGLPVDALTLGQAADRCREAIDTRKPLLVGVVNAAKAVSVRRDARLAGALGQCDMLLADGQSIVWASRLLGCPVPERVTGIDLFENLLALAEKDGRSVYLFGARPEVLTALEERLGRRYPRLKIAGSRNGYFREDEAAQIVADIRAAKPDMLFLGMPSPTKEMFLAAWKDTLAVPVMHGVGGSFDVLAGRTKRAPEAWQRLGMEWAYRLQQEPRRMWRRYLTTNTAFVVLTLRGMFGFDTSLPASVQTPDSLSEFRHG